MRVLAIGDIHGCSRALDHLLAAIGPRTSDVIITLGDYVDRGPDSSGVISRLIELRKKFKVVSLRGNHEQLMLNSRLGNDRLVEWLYTGGNATLASYARNEGGAMPSDVPREHWDFLEKSCVDWHETDTHLFVHAGVDPGLPMTSQPEFVLQWERCHNPQPHVSGKTVVCGHTAQKNGIPRDFGHAICIDTGCYRKAWLTCYEVTTNYLWQATQAGDFRSGWLEDFSDHAGVEIV